MRDKDHNKLEKLYESILLTETMSFFVRESEIGSNGYGDTRERYADDIYDVSGKFEKLAFDIIKKKMGEEGFNRVLDEGNWHPVRPEGDGGEGPAVRGHLVLDTTALPEDVIKTIYNAIKYYIGEINLELTGEPFEDRKNKEWRFPIRITKPEDFEEKNPPVITLSNSNMYLMLRVLNLNGMNHQEELRKNGQLNLNVGELVTRVSKIINDKEYLSKFVRPKQIDGNYHNMGFEISDIEKYLKELQRLLNWCNKHSVSVITIG
jgi:hypothetical protein